MEKSKKINIFSLIVLMGLFFGVLYHFVLDHYLNYSAPHNSFLYMADMSFCDFYRILPYLKDFKPYQEVTLWINYFPLAYIILLPFYFIKNLLFAYIIYISLFLYYLLFKNSKELFCENLSKLQNFQNFFIISFFSYPVLFALDKGNFDIYLFIMFGVFISLFQNKKYIKSAALLGVMNAIKPFTALFLFLFVFKNLKKEAAISIATSAILIFLGFCFFDQPVLDQIKNLLASVDLHNQRYAYSIRLDTGFNSSLFIPLKFFFLHFSTSETLLKIFVNFYTILTIIFTAITVFLVSRERLFWKQILLLVCNFLLMPFVTYDYKLIFLFIPLWLFFNEKNKSRFDLIYTILLALVFIPKSVIIPFPELQNNGYNWTTLSVFLNPLIFILITILIAFEQKRTSSTPKQ